MPSKARRRSRRPTLEVIAQLKAIYGLDLDAGASHKLTERGEGEGGRG